MNNIRNTSGNNITVEKDDKMGYITVNGTPNANYANIVEGLNITDLIEDKQTYTLKQENANSSSINYIYSQIITENKETLQKQYIDTRTTFNQTFTVDKTTNNYYANIQTGTIEDTGTLNNFKTRFMIYKGTEDKPYEPYTGGNPSPNPDYPQEIESIKDSITFKRIGKNYNKYPYYSGDSFSQNGLTYTVQEDLGIKIEGTSTGQSYYNLHKNYKLKKGTYKASVKGLTDNIFLNIVPYLKDGSHLDALVFDKNNTVKDLILEEDVALNDYIAIVNTDVTVNTTLYFQIEKGTEATEYEPYHEDIYTLPVQQNMYALVEGQEDCFVKKDGKWYERHYSFEGELTGENYYVDKPDTRIAIYNMNTYGFSTGVYNGKTKQYLNYFKFYNNWDARGSFIAANTLWFSGFSDIETFKEFIKTKKEEGNPIKIVYIRGKNESILYPLDLECTPEQTAVLNQLEQFSLDKGINHIFSDDELSPKFQLKYYQDINILLDKINKNIADVSAQLIEGGSNV